MARPATYFLNRQRESPDWILPGLLKRKNCAFILGEPKKACKSWLLLNLAWDLSEGKPIWDFPHEELLRPPRPMRTVIFSQEDTEDDLHDRIIDRLTTLGKRKPNDRLWVVPKNLQICFDSTEGIKLLQAELDSVLEVGPIDLVAFDPMRRMHYKSENDSEIIAQLWRVMAKIQERYNCSTLFNHHIIKPTGDPESFFDRTSPFIARGSGDIYGGGDAFINIVPHKEKLDKDGHKVRDLELYFESKRSQPLYPCLVRTDFETGLVSYVGQVKAKSSNSEDDDEITPMGNRQ